MKQELAVGKASPLLAAIRIIFRTTRIKRGGRLVDLIPSRLLGGKVIWADTDAGPLVLRIDETGSRQLLLYGHPLPDVEETKIVCALLPSARGILDIGAHYGWYSKLAANLMAPKALKIALEANPEVAACLQCSLSGLPGAQVLNVAGTDRARKISFYRAPDSGRSSAVRAVGLPIYVEGLPVDDVWPAGQPLDFVKCDVEGGELDVLRGSRQLRKMYEPVWMLEFDEQFLAEANVEPTDVADEVSDLLCWWRSDTDGWVLAEKLGAIIGKARLYKNVFLVPRRRAAQFTQFIKQ